MRFDTNDTGKYIFDPRQQLSAEDLYKLEDEYYAALKSRPSDQYRNMSYINAADTANQTVTYMIIGIIIILPLLLWFVIFRESPSDKKLFMTAGITLAGIGIMLIVKIILRLTVRQRVYTETVDAECIGYARYFESSSGGGTGTVSAVPYVSPVFTYRYEGTVYTGCYDGFDSSKDCPVGAGPVKIEISPGHPEAIYNRGSQQKDMLILFAAVFLIAGVVMTAAGLML